jgi:predicted Zn-dependent protease
VRSACLVAMTIADLAYSQVQDAGTSEIRKEWILGAKAAQDLDQRDGRIDDAALLNYLQRIETRITDAIGADRVEIRVSRSAARSATPVPNRVLYVSLGMLARVETESELAGMLAHELAHVQRGNRAVEIRLPPCVFASTVMSADQMRDEEVGATLDAVGYLKLADYDPMSAVEILSKLAYENPNWGKAIRSEDLLDLRATLEAERTPAGGYILDSSDFIPWHAGILAALSPATQQSPVSRARLRKP